MCRVLAGSRRIAWNRRIMGLLLFVAATSLAVSAVETSVPDEWIRDIVSMPNGNLAAMKAFIEVADAPETDEEARRLMLADPHGWFEENHGITLENAVFWTIDTTVTAPEGEPAWLFESEYLGDESLMDVAVVFSGPTLALFIQSSQAEDAPTDSPDAITQQFLEVISARSEGEWNRLLQIVLDVNRADEEQQALFEAQTRQALINYNQRLSGVNTRLLVINLPLGEAYGAVGFGEIPKGMVMTPQGLTILGDTAAIVYTTLF